jgi:hypothetical protein
MLLFGDSSGFISISDKNFTCIERKHKVFKGDVKGISYIFDPINPSRQFIITIGDDAKQKTESYLDESSSLHSPLYLIKVAILYASFINTCIKKKTFSKNIVYCRFSL